MKALITEVIGTFFLVLAIGLAVNASEPLAAIAIGSTLMVMVYAGGRISGAHYNPAVSLGLVVRGAMPAGKLPGYWAAQFTGAIIAGFLVWKFTGQPLHVAPAELTTPLKAIVGEAIATFGLAYVVMHVATGKGTEGNSYFGLAIGSTVTAFALAFGPITGGAFNPAVGIGPAIVEMALSREVSPLFWVYAVAPFLGAAAAGAVFKYQES
ncbi:MAG: aquaporin family protein [Gemmatimonadota bacterium]|nr:aquaporin family protein [Gemmatimonadota bacterium]